MDFGALIKVSLVTLILSSCVSAEQWPLEKAQLWYKDQGWLVGCNFIPSTAENTMEMWQKETFDPNTMDTELGYAEYLGFNIVRVFLHWLVWQEDPSGFVDRLNSYLVIADSHKIKTMFVLFDDCWNKEAHTGAQEPPIPGVHNSRWVQCPGDAEVTNKQLFPVFDKYVVQILDTFKNDNRVLVWDLYNEPGNSGHGHDTLPLLERVFANARTINLTQPVTAGLWNFGPDFHDINNFQVVNSDIITFHGYAPLAAFKGIYEDVASRAPERPVFCSEYMARTLDCKFETHLPYMKSINVGAINWGLVNGKTQTIYPWGSPPYSPPPKIWFHDIFNKDRSPFNATEVEFIRNTTLSSDFF